ncbi:SusC/RagA family TonB-linked outer membrane protein [Chitinophaga niabensis]|uniref:SusC/RagA family TonB-linked outer membrane protein n=1 Tax=Chitinophaga niabensis TaxID=536979 RepID=UPI0031BA7E29
MHQIYCPKFWSRWLLYAILLLSLHANAHSTQDSGRITLHFTNQPIEKVFRQIENQTGYAFFYGHSLLDPNSLVSIKADRFRLSQVMDVILKGKNITWKIKENGIVLSKKQDTEVRDSPTQISADSIPKITIRGTVNSDEGFPLPGASIQISGTRIGTVTNAQGQFILNGVLPQSILIISYTGFQLEQYIIKDNETLIVRLKKLIGLLDESVIIAYGTSSRRKLTGSVSRVTSADIIKQPVSNPLAALQGRMAGVQITQQTGVPGGGFRIQIRGQNSLRSEGNDPLYIIDGVPFTSTSLSNNLTSSSILGSFGLSPLNSINPNDIESVEVLKDADATAIYGSRGANGVVLITTKKGQAGKTRIDLNVYAGAGKVTKFMDLLNTDQYLEVRKEAYKNDNITVYPANAYDINGKWDQKRYTNWQRELIGGTAHFTDVQASISGGNNNTQFLVSGGYHKETTVFPGKDADQRASMHFSLNNKSANQRFKTALSASYSSQFTTLPGTDLSSLAVNLAPNAPSLYDSTGNLNWENSTWTNPLTTTKQPYNATANNLASNLQLNYELLPGLEIKSTFGYVNYTLTSIRKFPISAGNPATVSPVNSAYYANSALKSWSIEPQISWRRTLGKGRIEILGGVSFQEQLTTGIAQIGTGYSSESLLDDIKSADRVTISNSNYAEYRYHALFGRINYEFLGKYIFNITGRRDGSSRFGPDRRFANFGSIGMAWIFSGEGFIQRNIPLISFGKLRGSYGVTGSDAIGDYGYISTYQVSGTYQGGAGLNPSNLLNPDYSWETNRKLEAALEVGLVKDRLYFTIAWYRNRSSNQLVGYPLPPTSGFDKIQYNLPASVQNTGFEIEFTTVNFQSNKFSWTSSLNLTIPRNKLLSYPNIDASSFANTYAVGYPLTIRKLYYFKGVDAATGAYVVEDVDKNGLINANDLKSVKFVGQNFFGGLLNKLTYRGFQLDFLLQFVKQYGPNFRNTGFGVPGFANNQPTYILNRWKKIGDNALVQRYTSGGNVAALNGFINSASSDYIVSDASFIRLKNISVSYKIPPRWIHRLRLEGSRIYIQSQNILTFTNYEGSDPERQSANILPPLKVITAGIQITL